MNWEVFLRPFSSNADHKLPARTNACCRSLDASCNAHHPFAVFAVSCNLSHIGVPYRHMSI
eukprot:2549611-Amphidinium_carterae.1